MYEPIDMDENISFIKIIDIGNDVKQNIIKIDYDL